MPGLVQTLKVAADTYEQLVAVMRVIFGRSYTSATHYRVGSLNDGTPYLIFMWSDDAGSNQLLTKMSDPEAVASQVYEWLKNAEYGKEPDHDGDNSKGWLISVEGNYSWPPRDDGYKGSNYEVFTVSPEWIEYGK